jgi:uncharacterized protein (TIGR02145 family)
MQNKLLIYISILVIPNLAFSQKPCNNETNIAYGGLLYNIDEIGSQCWFSENLNIGTMINGKIEQKANGKIEKYCYDNDEYECRTFGGLYQWTEIMDNYTKEGSKGICPEGWHIPGDNDFKILEAYLGMNKEMLDKTGSRASNQGQKLLVKGESGFDVLYSGSRNIDGNFYEQNVVGSFWTSSRTDDEQQAITRYLIKDDKSVYRDKQNMKKGLSVRCLKN